ncbi:MAG: hypothetical protein WA871_11255 [Candidatus Acidiferrales bacterium]
MKRISFCGFFIAALLCVPVARCQQTPSDQNGTAPATPDQPLPPTTSSSSGNSNGSGAAPAGRSIFGSGGDSPDGTDQNAVLPLSGAQEVTSALGARPRNLFDASALLSASADSGVINTDGTPTWGGSEVLGGQVTYDHSWGPNSFSLGYSGGGILYQPSALFPDAMYHSLSVSQVVGWKRAKLTLIDQFSYSPNSLFGGAGIGGPGLLTETSSAASTLLNPTFSAGTSILTGQTRLVSNSAVAEGQFNLAPRTSLTVTGNYQLLDYTEGGFISSHDYVLGGGYNHTFTTKDTLAVTYTFSEDLFTGSLEYLDFNLINAAYSHQLTDRLVFQIAAGPDFIEYHNYVPRLANAVTWELNAGVNYHLRRTSFAAMYTHGTNSGSGVFSGSISQTAGGSVSHQFSRFVVGAVSGGYSINGNLAMTAGVENQFRNWYLAANAGRQLGRYSHISLNYGVEQQPYGGVCPVASCGTNRAVQTIGVAVDIHVRPIGSGE